MCATVLRLRRCKSSHNEAQNYQVKWFNVSLQKPACTELPSPHLCLSFSSLLPCSPSLSSYTPLSLSLPSHLPPLLVLQETEWHHHPHWRTAVCEKLNVYAVCRCAGGGTSEINSLNTRVVCNGRLRSRLFTGGRLWNAVCCLSYYTVCEWWEEIRGLNCRRADCRLKTGFKNTLSCVDSVFEDNCKSLSLDLKGIFL